MEKELEKVEFELEDEESDSIEEVESKEEEPHTPILRRTSQERRKPYRYLPLYFLYCFDLSITDDDLINVKEVIDSKDNNRWKKAMVKEIDALDKN